MGTVSVRPPRGGLQGIVWSGKNRIHAMIDEVPLAAVLATFADGVSRLEDCEELRFKETDRLNTTRDLLRAFGRRLESQREVSRS